MARDDRSRGGGAALTTADGAKRKTAVGPIENRTSATVRFEPWETCINYDHSQHNRADPRQLAWL